MSRAFCVSLVVPSRHSKKRKNANANRKVPHSMRRDNSSENEKSEEEITGPQWT